MNKKSSNVKNNVFTISCCFLIIFNHLSWSQPCEPVVTDLVNPFIGTDRGNILPGSSLPFGLVKLSPDVKEPQPTSGYSSKKAIAGFSHTHTSGTGGGARYGNVMIIPQVGKLDITDYVAIKKVNEYAKPGYYAVTLARKPGDVRSEVTTTRHAGFHQYQFYTWDKAKQFDANILIDVSHTNTRGGKTDSRCTGGTVQIVNDTLIEGRASCTGGWGKPNPYTIYFSAAFDTKFQEYGLWKDSTLKKGVKEQKIENKNDSRQKFGAFARFKVGQNQKIKIKVGISLISTSKARENLQEIPHWNFFKTRMQADSIWNNYLSKITVQGGTPEQRIMFYSCLRNTMIMPTNISDENLAEPNSKKTAFWDYYCIWDVFRSAMPLHTIILTEHQQAVVQNLINIYEKHGWLPDAWIAGDYSNIQGGTNADVVIADAIIKNLNGFDKEKAYEAIKKNAEVISDNPAIYGRYLEEYQKLGYLTNASANGASSRTLEYAYCDFCISQVARKLRKTNDYKKYLQRSMQVFTLFYDSAKCFWAKGKKGNWQPGFSFESKRSDNWNDPYFYEGGARTYSVYTPHNMKKLIDRHGGNQQFIEYLNSIFDKGHYRLSNEPLFLVPYQYNYALRPDITALRVRQVLDRQFFPARKGLPGQDDSGAISSWYVFSAMGFFPVAGQDVYLLGSPVFDKIEISLANGKTFKIKTKKNSEKNKYIQSATLNGKQFNKSWFTHTELMQGGQLILQMTDKPSNWGKTESPPSY